MLFRSVENCSDGHHSSFRLATKSTYRTARFGTQHNHDAIDPTVTITESQARLFQHTSKNPSDYPDITQMRNMSVIAKDTANSGIDTGAKGEGATGRIVGSEGATANANATTPLSRHPELICAWIWGMPAV